MTFGNPLFLWGALAAAIPLLIHLFDRRRPRTHAFGAISFVLRSQKRTASRLKLKRLILYILRTMLLVALPVALARPSCADDAKLAPTTSGPAATAIVLDTSLSMRFKDGNEALFEKARGLALDALTGLLPEEPATVVLCGAQTTPPGAPAFDRAGQRQLLDDAQAGFGLSDMSRCTELAAKALEESPLRGKRIVLVSDFTQTAFRLEAPAPIVKLANGEPVHPEIVLKDAADKEDELPNHAIASLRVEPALNVGPRAYAFGITVRNFSKKPVKDLEASLKVGDRIVAKGFVDVAAGGTAQKTLTHRFEEGGTVFGAVTLSEDALAEDDSRPFVLGVPRALKALIVNGAPNTVRYRDEAFFVEAALHAPGSPVEARVLDADAASREPLNDYDVLLFLNVPAPSPEFAAKLRGFVEQGGGLFLSMGDGVEPDVYNERFGSLLPRPLRLMKTAALPDETDAAAKAARMGEFDLDHPILSPFAGAAREGIAEARFYRYMLLEAQGTEASTVLATFGDGAPALAIGRRGKGRVALLTSTVDRDWGDLAIRTGFLPLMQRLSGYLAGTLEERDETRARVGETLHRVPSDRNPVTQYRTPSGTTLETRPGAEGRVDVGPLSEPGIYVALGEGDQPVPEQSFPVLLDAAESDLARVNLDALIASYGEASVKREAGPSEQPKVPVWTWLFVSAVVAFCLEGVLLRR